jgi:hypothetical protein
MPRKKATEENGKPEFEPMLLYHISPEGWVEMERNRQNLSQIARLCEGLVLWGIG